MNENELINHLYKTIDTVCELLSSEHIEDARTEILEAMFTATRLELDNVRLRLMRYQPLVTSERFRDAQGHYDELRAWILAAIHSPMTELKKL